MNIAKALMGSSDWYQKQWEQVSDQISDVPWLILWGTQDEFMTMKYFQKWKDRLPKAEKKEFACGHFVQEEKQLRPSGQLLAFWKDKNTSI
ncbi:MAG: alpha/beta fold hydrolase [Owenweeksia sp.]|nr:alpha/beta fold hydrolase [Owenweeksia sp.]